MTLGETGRKRDELGRDGEKERRPFHSCLPAWLFHSSADLIAAVASKSFSYRQSFRPRLGTKNEKMRYPTIQVTYLA